MRIGRILGETYAEAGRSMRGFFAGGSIAAGRVVVEALLYLSWVDFAFSEVLDALEMESRILWNLRLVVLIAVPVGILRKSVYEAKQNV